MRNRRVHRVRRPGLRRRATRWVVAILMMLGASGPVFAATDRPLVDLSAWTGGEKPEFTLDDLDKRPVASRALPGQVLVVHFFATWCEPCLVEIPALRRLVERSDPALLRVLAISVGEVDVRVRNFFDRVPVNFTVLLDRDRGVARSWGIYALPTTYILGHDRTPRYFVERDHDWDRLDVAALLTALAAPPGNADR